MISYEPMLATPWKRPFDDPGWWFEVKWDGVRAVTSIEGASVRLRSRRGLDMIGSYPELSALRSAEPVVIDGEIVALDEQGRPSFSLLQQRMGVTGSLARAMAERAPVTLVAFDLLHAGAPMIDRPIEERWDRLAAVMPAGMTRSEATRGEGLAMYEAVAAAGLEGVVAKRSGSVYRPGQRSPDWRKIVRRRSARFVVGGYLPGEGTRGSTFSSLLLGLWDGDHLRFVGAVGSGFEDSALVAVRAALDEMGRPTSPFYLDAAVPRDASWVEPMLVAVVEYREWTHESRLRAPVFKGFSGDPVETVTWQAEGPES